LYQIRDWCTKCVWRCCQGYKQVNITRNQFSTLINLASCFFCVLLINKKHINFVLESNENSYQDWFQLATWSQRRLKCESLWMTMVTMMDTKWWQYIAWPIESGELKRCWTWNKDKTMKLLHFSLIQEPVKLCELITKCIGITIETRPDYCLRKHIRFETLLTCCWIVFLSLNSVKQQ
jgi:hypothetical protein